MAKKPTEKQLYKLKNEWLGQFFEEVKPKEFYRAVFPEGSFERKGHFEDGKANGIITIVENDKAKNRIVFDDLSVIDEVKGAEFAVMSPVAYSGRNRTAANARWLYGIAIDLDGVEMPQLRDVFHQMNHDIIPKCTYCINSGHGLHLYYLLEKPVPLYKHDLLLRFPLSPDNRQRDRRYPFYLPFPGGAPLAPPSLQASQYPEALHC